MSSEFGAFFYNLVNEEGETYALYTSSGGPAMPLKLFDAARHGSVRADVPRGRRGSLEDLTDEVFRGEGVVRCDDVTRDSRYGKDPARPEIPGGRLPVRSYLASPVISRSGEVLGGLFFGHSAPGKFTETHETIVAGIAAQAAIAMDNAHLFERAQWVQGELKRSNEELRRANQDLEMFAYSASHDLQEPLRTISISAQILERDWAGS